MWRLPKINRRIIDKNYSLLFGGVLLSVLVEVAVSDFGVDVLSVFAVGVSLFVVGVVLESVL
ncbi:MAG: hypothetical protein ACKODD_08675 [Candidatus Nanopelagicus sp.]